VSKALILSKTLLGGGVFLALTATLFIFSQTPTKALEDAKPLDVSVLIEPALQLSQSNCDSIANPNTNQLALTVSPSSPFDSDCQDLSIDTNAPGYSLSIQASTHNTNYNSDIATNNLLYTDTIFPTPFPIIAAVSTTTNSLTSPSTLSTPNTWGFAITSNNVNPATATTQYLTNFQPYANYSPNNTANTYANPPLTATTLYHSEQFPAQTDVFRFYYATFIDAFTVPGHYGATVTYSVVAEDVVCPYDSDLVYDDVNCVEPEPPTQTPFTVNNGSQGIVETDANMIPVKYTGDTTTPEWQKADITNASNDWFDYDNQQWANAVTVSDEDYNTAWNNYSDPVFSQPICDALASYYHGSDFFSDCLTHGLEMNLFEASPLVFYRDMAPAGVEISERYILGYWTYIPRYAYEVQRYHAWNKPSCGNGQSGAAYADANCDSSMFQSRFDIKFEKASDTKKTPSSGDTACKTAPASAVTAANYTGGTDYRTSCGVDRTYGAATGTTWSTHPAFTFGSTELNGIWVGKFETTGTNTAPTIKPNQHANISELAAEYFLVAKSIAVDDPAAVGGANTPNPVIGPQNSHNLATAKSHMQKNSEWGAVAYLATSIYGANGNKVQMNSAYPNSGADADGTSSRNGITGCGPSASGSTATYADGTALNATTTSSPTACSASTSRAYYGSLGQLASTTQNPYGVYDMSGGVYEYVMGNYNTVKGGTSAIVVPDAPYVDFYMATQGFTSPKQTWSNSSTSNYYYFDDCTYQTCGGHANYETTAAQSVSANTLSWGKGWSSFVYTSAPWFTRGSHSSDLYAGLFVSNYNSGTANNSTGFRVVII
jgi:hypothetical protein